LCKEGAEPSTAEERRQNGIEKGESASDPVLRKNQNP